VRERAPKFEVYVSFLNETDRRKSEWRWRLLAGNGEIIAEGEGYTNAADCRRAVRAVKRNVVKIVEAERAAT
jgi:uncharacterized protein YegP (UPF0339 family)